MTSMNIKGPVELDVVADGSLWRMKLNTPKANIIDAEVIAQLTDLFQQAKLELGLKAILLEAEGPNFSFGASVVEHLPEHVGHMLPSFHNLFESIIDCAVYTASAVRGNCLGGGLELVLATNRIFSAPNAKLGQPEIALGVFAPIASLFLPGRVGASAAEELCLTGRVVSAAEAKDMGLVDAMEDNPESAAMAYIEKRILPHSSSSLRFAQRAVRQSWHQEFSHRLRQLEALYLDELMATQDAAEGIQAFIEKRTPEWRGR